MAIVAKMPSDWASCVSCTTAFVKPRMHRALSVGSIGADKGRLKACFAGPSGGASCCISPSGRKSGFRRAKAGQGLPMQLPRGMGHICFAVPNRPAIEEEVERLIR